MSIAEDRVVQRQADIRGFIRWYTLDNRSAPSVKEIAEEFELPLKTAYWTVYRMMDLGEVVRTSTGGVALPPRKGRK